MSWANAMTQDTDYVSAKHCQEGSDYSLYEIRICNSESNDFTFSIPMNICPHKILTTILA